MLSRGRNNIFKKENIFVSILTGAAFVALFGYGCLKGYHFYNERKQKAAQALFSDVLHEYEKVLKEQFKGEQSAQALAQQWEDVVVGLTSVEADHASTVYGAASYAVHASIAMEKHLYDEAFSFIDLAIKNVSKSSPLYNIYRTKRALMCMDGNKVEEGIAALKELITDTANNSADTAAFYLGYYYWTNNDIAQAKEIWKFFTLQASNEKPEAVSPWAQIVQSKLAYCA